MLPDLRIVIAAVISTFVLTVGVGFFASSRLINEPKKSTDSIAALDATPVNRIALSWPAPARQPEPLALDFAVTAKALRNPVRDVTNEPSVVEQRSEPAASPIRITATDLAAQPAERSPARPQQVVVPAPTEAAPASLGEAPKPAQVPEPDIRVAVQYPPILELPPELQTPIAPPASAVVAVEVPSESPVTTGSIAEPPKTAEVKDGAAPQPAKEADTKTVSRPDPADASASGEPAIENAPIPKPAPKAIPAKADAKKAAAKKAAAKKTVRRPVRRAAPAAPNTVPNFFNLFTLQQPR
jgi:hypothetical protein